MYIYHMYYIIMPMHTLLYVGLPHVKGFLMFLGIGPGAALHKLRSGPDSFFCHWPSSAMEATHKAACVAPGLGTFSSLWDIMAVWLAGA